MSASREKKQRQGAGPSEKALQAQQQQAARRRKTIIYTVIGVVAAVLVAALLIWNSGFFQSRATAATIGDTNLTTAELSYYYYSTRNYYASYMSLMGSFDSSLPDDEQYYNQEENVTLRDYFLESALSDAQRYQALYNEALAAGHTDAEVQESLDANIERQKSSAASNGYSYGAYLKAMYGPYITPGIYEKLTRQALLGELAYQDKGLDLYQSYGEQELRDYYKENADSLDTFEYSVFSFSPADVETKDADGNELDEDTVNKLKEEALTDAKKKADAALAAYESGKSVADIGKEFGPSTTSDHITTVGTGNLNPAYQEKLLTLKRDEAALVEDSSSVYYLVIFHDRYLLEEPTKDVRHIAILAETTTNDSGTVVAPTDEAWAAAKEKMDAVQAEFEAGSKTEDAFIALAEKYSEDGGSNTSGGLVERIASDNASLVPEFLSWTYEDGRQPGDWGVIQHSAADSDTNKYWGYHLMYMVGDNEPVWMDTSRSSLATEARRVWLEELTAPYAITQAGGANYLGR